MSDHDDIARRDQESADKDRMKSLDLRKPEDARWYIDNFKIPGTPGPVTEVTMSGGRVIKFASMSDEDAVLVANDFYQMEIEAAMRSKKDHAPLQ